MSILRGEETLFPNCKPYLFAKGHNDANLGVDSRVFHYD